MFRRDFFKMLGAAAVSVACAPLAKLLRVGQVIRIKKPVRYFSDRFAMSDRNLALSIEDFTRRYTLPAIRKIADEYEADHAFVTGNSWPS